MSKFIIQPHGRLNDWVAEEKGYFKDEGLDYYLNLDASYKMVPQLPEAAQEGAEIKDNLIGAFEKYTAGHGRKGSAEDSGDVSCACHWTVNQAAKLQDGVMYGRAYSVCEAAIVVADNSEIRSPEDLAGVEVAVGYHSGSHYSALQALELFIDPEEIALKFSGTSWSRVDAAVAKKIKAVNVWGAQLYLLEQLGFRRIASTTFMMGYMFPADTERKNVESYMRALIRAQADIDAAPEKFKHYYEYEIPDRYLERVDVRRFGTGERVVPQPYTQAMFESTQSWMHERELFDFDASAGVSYDEAVFT